jgi:hypothetical protein
MPLANKPLSTFKELSLEQTRTDLSLPISIIKNNNAKTALYNINRILNRTDVSKVDYTEGGTSGHALEPLNNLFSDNIVLYYYIPDKDVQESKVLTAFLNNTERWTAYEQEKARIEYAQKKSDSNFKEKLDAFIAYGTKGPHNTWKVRPQTQKQERLRAELQDIKQVKNEFKATKAERPIVQPIESLDKFKALAPFLAESTKTIKNLFNKYGLAVDKSHIKPTTPKVMHKRITQLVKVSLANCSYDTVIELLEFHSKDLEDAGFYVHDIDFTRDYKGVFNKEQLTQHLLANGFRFQEGDHAWDTCLSCEDANATILANNNKVSRNCLSFISDDRDGGSVRYKFYNKFVQFMESPSVRGKVGNHFADWCNNPDKKLREAIPKCLDSG